MDYSRPFFRFTIATKMLIGYLGLSVIIIIITSPANSSIKHLIEINNNVITVDAPVVEAASKMEDVIFAEELYGRSYLQQRSPAMFDSYNKELKECAKSRSGSNCVVDSTEDNSR